MSNKVYLNGIIVVAVIFVAVAIFGTTNHFSGYYNPSGKTKNNNNSNNNPKPTPNPKPNPEPTGKEIQGYKCTSEKCVILNGTSTINDKFIFISDGEENIDIWEDVQYFP